MNLTFDNISNFLEQEGKNKQEIELTLSELKRIAAKRYYIKIMAAFSEEELKTVENLSSEALLKGLEDLYSKKDGSKSPRAIMEEIVMELSNEFFQKYAQNKAAFPKIE